MDKKGINITARNGAVAAETIRQGTAGLLGTTDLPVRERVIMGSYLAEKDSGAGQILKEPQRDIMT